MIAGPGAERGRARVIDGHHHQPSLVAVDAAAGRRRAEGSLHREPRGGIDDHDLGEARRDHVQADAGLEAAEGGPQIGAALSRRCDPRRAGVEVGDGGVVHPEDGLFEGHVAADAEQVLGHQPEIEAGTGKHGQLIGVELQGGDGGVGGVAGVAGLDGGSGLVWGQAVAGLDGRSGLLDDACVFVDVGRLCVWAGVVDVLGRTAQHQQRAGERAKQQASAAAHGFLHQARMVAGPEPARHVFPCWEHAYGTKKRDANGSIMRPFVSVQPQVPERTVSMYQ